MLTKQQKVKTDSLTTFESIKDQTTEEYFNGNEFSIDAFNRKYTSFPGETYVQAIKRVCDYAACAEAPDKQSYWSARWFDEIYNDWWQPAGSIMQGANSGKKISLFNCTTISMGTNRDDEEWDNLESIFKNTSYTVAKAAAYRQGLGVDFSRLRPAGASVLNSANVSTGAIHWMKFIDSIGYYVGQKGRIPAMLFSISCEHPDVLDFIKIKSNREDIQNANISVQCTDAFYKAVENDGEWELKFEIPEIKKGQKVYINVNSKEEDSLYDEKSSRWYYIAKKNRPYEKISHKVKARTVAELIAQNMCEHAEPGIQNIDIARKYSNSDYVYDSQDEYDSRIVSTNACCVVGISKILTNEGWLSIEDIYERYCGGDRSLLAMSYNIENKEYEFKPILNAWQQRNDLTVELLIEDKGNKYRIECSSDHKILTKNRGYVPAINLNVYDEIVVRN